MYTSIKKNECLICFQKLYSGMNLKEFFYYDDVICCKCRHELIIHKQTLKIGNLEIESLYLYEGIIRNLLLQYKELYDEALAPVFLYTMIKRIQREYQDYILIPIPSAKTKVAERGFNHIEEIFSQSKLPIYSVLEKTEEKQQKTLNMKERSKISFHLKEKDSWRGKKVLLIDDVITSGNSMIQSYNLLHENTSKIKGFAICYHERLLKEVL